MCKKVLKASFLPLVSGGVVDCKETEEVKPPAGKPPNPIIMLIFQSFNHGSDTPPYYPHQIVINYLTLKTFNCCKFCLRLNFLLM